MHTTSWTGRGAASLVLVALALVVSACGGGALGAAGHPHHSHRHLSAAAHGGTTTTRPDAPTSTTSSSPSSTTTSDPSSTTTAPTAATSSPAAAPPAPPAPPASPAPHGPITEPPLPAAGPGFVADQVTAVGDSVMIDYEGALAQDLPGVHVTAAVSRWWTTGVGILRQLKAQDALGAVVIVGLGTNGPVSAAQFDAMMSVLAGASRVVFVNVRVDRTWQGANNAVLDQGVAGFSRATLVDWYSLAVQNPDWLYATQTHMPIDGPGAQALAALVAAAA